MQQFQALGSTWTASSLGAAERKDYGRRYMLNSRNETGFGSSFLVDINNIHILLMLSGPKGGAGLY